MQKKVTIADVAKIAGVSRATVSYVINNINKVSNGTRERVLKVIEELNYQPDFTAVSLSNQKSKLIGVMIPSDTNNLASILKNDSSYSELIAGIEYVSRQSGYDLLISATKETEECITWIKKRHLEGLIISGLVPSDLYEKLNNLGIPAVLIDNYEQHGEKYTNIRIEDKEGGYLATSHLLDNGHNQIFFIGHDLKNISVDLHRIKGIKKAFDARNQTFKDEWIISCKDSTFENGYEAGLKILNKLKPNTAIFASSDILAIGLMKALNDNNIRVPEDISIIGFDNIPIAEYVNPALSTIMQDIYRKGTVAAKILLGQINDPSMSQQSIILPVSLICRDSVRTL